MASGSRLVGSLLLGLYDDDGLLNHVGFTSTSQPRPPALTKRLEKLVSRPASPARRRAGRAAGPPSDRRNGSRCGRSSSSRCATITSPATASATARSFCAGGRTRRRINAPSIRSSRRRSRAACSAFPRPSSRNCAKLASRLHGRLARAARRRNSRPGARQQARRRRPPQSPSSVQFSARMWLRADLEPPLRPPPLPKGWARCASD